MRNSRLYYEKRIHLPRKTSKRQNDATEKEKPKIVAHEDDHLYFRQAAVQRLDDEGTSVTTEDAPDKVATLGRPFRIGNFYDARTGRLIVGLSPWSHDTLQNTTESHVESTKFTSTDSNTLENDMIFFDMDPSLQAQFINGEIKVAGSAAFLKEERKSNRIIRSVMMYKDTSKFITLKSGSLNKVEHVDSLMKMRKIATHVVTGLELGTRAVLAFERPLEEGENRVKANQELFAQVKGIASVDFTDEGNVNMTKEEADKIKNCTAKFYGDFILKAPPLSYWDALALYYHLPNLIEDARAHPQPMTAYMFPLKKLFDYSLVENQDPESHQDGVDQVPMDLRDQMLDLFETIDDLQREIQSIKDRPVTRFHSRIWDQLTIFENHIDMYETHMKTEFGPLVPLIIQGNVTKVEAEEDARKLLQADALCPFSAKNMRKWMREKEEEVEVLMAKIDLPNRCMHEGHFSSVLHHPTCTYTCALVLKVGHYKDTYLEVLNEYLDTKEPAVFTYEGKSDALEWWDPLDKTQSTMFKKAADLQEWIRLEERKAKKKLVQTVNFAVRERLLEKNEQPHIKLELYRDGTKIDDNYEIPGKPGKPKAVGTGATWITLSWEKAQQGAVNVGGYEIETLLSNFTVHNSSIPYHQSVLDSCTQFYCHLRTDFAYGHENNKIEDLEPGTEYRFRVVVYSKYHHPSAISQISAPVWTKQGDSRKKKEL